MPAVEQRKPAFSITNRAEFRFLFFFQALALSHCLSRARLPRRPARARAGLGRPLPKSAAARLAGPLRAERLGNRRRLRRLPPPLRPRPPREHRRRAWLGS